MDFIDRTRIPAIHAAASRARSEYVHGLLRRLARMFSNEKIALKSAVAGHV